jgi:hypothetical protein
MVQFKVKTTKKPFSKTCAILIQHAIGLAAPVPEEFQVMKDITDFHRALTEHYKEMVDKGLSTRRVGAGGVQITMNKDQQIIWIERPGHCESAFATITCEQSKH